MMLCKPLFIV